MLTAEVKSVGAWPEHPISPSDWKMSVSGAVVDELLAAGEVLKRNPLPLAYVSPQNYKLDESRRLASDIRAVLDEGVRFVLLDRMPVEETGPDIAVQLYWLLSSLIARPVAQKLDGTLIYHVQDKGLAPAPGSGIRPADTNYEQLPHTDNAFNTTAPEVVGLLCLKDARSGGVSRCLSFLAVHNRLMREAPDLLKRLYEPFPHDRQREYWPDQPSIVEHPIFTYEGGKLLVRFSPHQIRNAYKMLNREMDQTTRDALACAQTLCGDPSMWVEFNMTPGQIQYVNNLEAGHARSGFEDFDEPEERRHMVRIWLRDAGRPDYFGF
jgi:alpha-ketoglutarate-dependent taurine dioxygenase